MRQLADDLGLSVEELTGYLLGLVVMPVTDSSSRAKAGRSEGGRPARLRLATSSG